MLKDSVLQSSGDDSTVQHAQAAKLHTAGLALGHFLVEVVMVLPSRNAVENLLLIA